MIIITVPVGELYTNCYLVTSGKTKETMIIDPGDEPLKIIKEIDRNGLKPVFIVNTHFHGDHIGADLEISKRYGVPCFIGETEHRFIKQWKTIITAFTGTDLSLINFSRLLKDKEILTVGELSFEVIETPGHSPGSICLYGHDSLFSGDTLFHEDVGRVDIPGGSEKDLIASFKRLISLPDGTKVYPGHGRQTSIKKEKASNALVTELGL